MIVLFPIFRFFTIILFCLKPQEEGFVRGGAVEGEAGGRGREQGSEF